MNILFKAVQKKGGRNEHKRNVNIPNRHLHNGFTLRVTVTKAKCYLMSRTCILLYAKRYVKIMIRFACRLVPLSLNSSEQSCGCVKWYCSKANSFKLFQFKYLFFFGWDTNGTQGYIFHCCSVLRTPVLNWSFQKNTPPYYDRFYYTFVVSQLEDFTVIFLSKRRIK